MVDEIKRQGRECILIESPFWNPDSEMRLTYAMYLKRAMINSLSLGEAPFACHWMYPPFLPTPEGSKEEHEEHRRIGLECGRDWALTCAHLAFYTDYGISPGMQDALEFAVTQGLQIEFRRIGLNEGSTETPDKENYE